MKLKRYLMTISLTAVTTSAVAIAILGSPPATAQPAPTGSASRPQPAPTGAGTTSGSDAPANDTGNTQSVPRPPEVQSPEPGKAPDTTTNTAGGAGTEQGSPAAPAGTGGSATPAPEGAGSAGAAGSAAGSAQAGSSAAAPAAGSAAAPAAGTTDGGAGQWYEQLADRPIGDDDGNLWMPKAVNIEADASDKMFFAIYGLTLFFTVAIFASVIFFTIKYRHRPGHKAEPSAAHNDALEITWTVIPTIICVFLFYYGWRTYVNLVTPPTKAVEVNVTAWKWSWDFRHANGVTDTDLHVPVDTPVRLVMTSRDVLHAFYAPVMRVKQDIIPRRYTYAWFRATKPGTYRLACAEYCGTDHSQMGRRPTPGHPESRRTVVVVHKPGDYERYLADKQALEGGGDPVEHGKRLYTAKGCVSCHTIDGAPRIGPTFKGTWGTTVQTSAGPTLVDEDYIRESLLVPGAKVRNGYPNQMTSFAGQLKERDIEGIIAYIKSLGAQ